MKARTAVWFRNDLRVRDHEPLLAAASAGPVDCVYCVDDRAFDGTRELGLPRTGAFRAQFLIESLADLRARLRRLGGELLVRRGRPEDVLPEMARGLGWSAVHYHRRVGTEEEAVEAAVDEGLAAAGCSVVRSWDLTLLDPEELPFEIADTPAVFTRFRKAVEKLGGFAAPLEAPAHLTRASHEDPGELPALAELGLEPRAVDERAPLRFEGGETAGKARLNAYFWNDDRLRRYKRTRNGMVAANDSSKLSPWLAHGCLSPRWVQSEVERYERERARNESTYWLTFELLWRDYFQLIAAKHGAQLFRASGLQGLHVPWLSDEDSFAAWSRGTTGYPIVDANMRELASTGFLSNRGRQIVASFLTKNLGIDWRWGAEWFESMLVDHDVASNYGNWNYTAGVGNDARGFRYFHLPTQAAKYDRNGVHARRWCPELTSLADRRVHTPWSLSREEQQRCGFVLGRDYPRPIVDLDESVRVQRDAWEAAIGA